MYVRLLLIIKEKKYKNIFYLTKAISHDVNICQFKSNLIN